MTLREYIETLKSFAEENPEALEMEVIASEDPEGNGYYSVYYDGPSKGLFEDGYFISANNFEEYERNESEANAVCIN